MRSDMAEEKQLRQHMEEKQDEALAKLQRLENRAGDALTSPRPASPRPSSPTTNKTNIYDIV